MNSLVGKSIPRKEGRRKVTGQALYVDDLKFDGMLHGVTVRSSVPRGRIKSISFDQPPATAGGSDCRSNGHPANRHFREKFLLSGARYARLTACSNSGRRIKKAARRKACVPPNAHGLRQ